MRKSLLFLFILPTNMKVMASENIPLLKEFAMESICKSLNNRNIKDRINFFKGLKENFSLPVELIGQNMTKNGKSQGALHNYLEHTRRWIVKKEDLPPDQTANEYPITFSPDGSLLITSKPDKKVDEYDINGSSELKIWDIQNARQLKCILAGYAGNQKTVKVTPDSKFILFGMTNNVLTIRNALLGSWVINLSHQNNIHTTAMSKLKNKFLSAGRELILSEMSDMLSVRTIHRSGIAVVSATFFKDDSLIATGSEDGKLRIWDIRSDTIAWKAFSLYRKPICSTLVTSYGTKIITGSDNGIVYLFDIHSNSSIPVATENNPIKMLSLTPDDKKLIIVTNNAIKMVNLIDYKSTDLLTNCLINSVVVTPDGSDAVCCVSECNTVTNANSLKMKIFDLSSTKLIASYDLDGSNMAVSKSHLAVNSPGSNNIQLFTYGMNWKDILRHMPIDAEPI